MPLYVGAGAPSWQVNIPERQVELYEKRAMPGAPPTRNFFEHETFTILGLTIRVADLFVP